MGIFGNLGHYDPQKLDADFNARMAQADADIEFRADRKFEQDIKPYEEEVKETCEKCGQPVHRIVRVKEVHPSVRKFEEKMAKEDLEIELKTSPPDLDERFRTEPMYIRKQRRRLRSQGVPEHLISDTIAAGIGVIAERGARFGASQIERGTRYAAREVGGAAGRVAQEAGLPQTLERAQQLATEEERQREIRLGRAIKQRITVPAQGLLELQQREAKIAAEERRQEMEALVQQEGKPLFEAKKPPVMQEQKQGIIQRVKGIFG